jgi:hypothetical protein
VDYKEYLKTEHWQEIRELKLQSVNYKCQICNSNKELNIHHRSYENLYNEQNHLEDLTVLCKECHGLYHDRLAKIPIRYSVERLDGLLERFKIQVSGGLLSIPEEVFNLDQEDRDWIIKNWEKIKLRKERIILIKELSEEKDEDSKLLINKKIDEIDKEIKKIIGE